MQITLIFLITAAVSFAGSIHLGAVNLAVIQTTLNRNFRAGVWVALGGSFPEFIYATLAIIAGQFLMTNSALIKGLEFLIIPIFVGIGFLNFFQKATKKSPILRSESVHFSKGFMLALLNPQLPIYWFLFFLYLDKIFIINELSMKMSFILGTGFGAFGILWLFAYLSEHQRERILPLLQKFPLNKVVGVTFWLLAAAQIFNFFY